MYGVYKVRPATDTRLWVKEELPTNPRSRVIPRALYAFPTECIWRSPWCPNWWALGVRKLLGTQSTQFHAYSAKPRTIHEILEQPTKHTKQTFSIFISPYWSCNSTVNGCQPRGPNWVYSPFFSKRKGPGSLIQLSTLFFNLWSLGCMDHWILYFESFPTTCGLPKSDGHVKSYGCSKWSLHLVVDKFAPANQIIARASCLAIWRPRASSMAWSREGNLHSSEPSDLHGFQADFALLQPVPNLFSPKPPQRLYLHGKEPPWSPYPIPSLSIPPIPH